MVRINRLFHLLINRVYWGYSPLILTSNPNLLTHLSKSADVKTAGPLQKCAGIRSKFAENTSLYPKDRCEWYCRPWKIPVSSVGSTLHITTNDISISASHETFQIFLRCGCVGRIARASLQALSIVAQTAHQTIISCISSRSVYLSSQNSNAPVIEAPHPQKADEPRGLNTPQASLDRR